jgi:16S rRNA (cytidine1402-2'-O)-methyltransferase
MEKKGILYVIPSPLGEGGTYTLSAHLLEIVFALDYFIVERGKTARAFLKAIGFPRPLQVLEFRELNEHTPSTDIPSLLAPLLSGQSAGLLSEAGCPGIADPGSPLIALAHQKGVEVVPLTGPSAIFLALMASGLNGQHFTFLGYLPAKKPDLLRRIKQLEQQSARERATQIFIETPYRNEALLQSLLHTLSPSTRLCIAANLTLPGQFIRTLPVAEWKRQGDIPQLSRQPTVFLLEAAT